MSLEHNYDLLRFDGKLKWHDRLCAVAYVSLCFDAGCCAKAFSTTGFCRAAWLTETPRKAEVLCIDIVSLSNQIPLILPSKASSFLGWEILEFLFQCSMFVFQTSQWCQVFLAEQLVLSARAAAGRFQAAWSHVEFSALCGVFFSITTQHHPLQTSCLSHSRFGWDQVRNMGAWWSCCTLTADLLGVNC